MGLKAGANGGDIIKTLELEGWPRTEGNRQTELKCNLKDSVNLQLNVLELTLIELKDIVELYFRGFACTRSGSW